MKLAGVVSNVKTLIRNAEKKEEEEKIVCRAAEELMEAGRAEERKNTEKERRNAEKERKNAEKERKNTERERLRAEKEKLRAEKAEADNKMLREEIAKLKAKRI